MDAFAACLSRAVRREEIEVHGFVFMNTHFHLLVRSPSGRLSEAMRRVLNEYTRYFNRTRERDGTVWRGRFSSKRIDSKTHRRILLRYIDRNPVAAGMVASADEYPHGSARCFSRREMPEWLDASWVDAEVLARTGSRMSEGGSYAEAFPFTLPPALVRLVEARQKSVALDVDELDDLIVASPEWLREWFARRARIADGTQPAHPVVDPDTVLTLVADYARVHGDFEIRPRRKRRSALDGLKVVLLRALAGETQAEIARRLGISKPTVHSILADHARVAAVSAYAAAAEALTRSALSTCFSAELPPQQHPSNPLQRCLTPE